MLADVIAATSFRNQRVLTGERVRLEPLTSVVLEDYLAAMADPEVTHLTGTHTMFDRAIIQAWLESRQQHHDRADWAIMRIEDGAFLGEAVLNDLDADNAAANYRVWLAGRRLFGRGYGTETTRLVIGYALDTVGLHRLSLGVYDFNSRAQRVYEKCGFIPEGRRRDALRCEGKWHDEVLMSILSTDPRSATSP